MSRYPEFREAFVDVLAVGPLLVDLQDATGVDSTFLSELLLFKRRRAPSPLAVLIARGSEVQRTFELANLRQKVGVFTDLSEAIASLGITPDAEPSAPLARETEVDAVE